MIYHYTSLDAFLQILGGVKDPNSENLTLWSSSAYTMSDAMEMQLGYTMLRNFIEVYESKTFGKTNLYSKLPPEGDILFSGKESSHFMTKENTPFVISFTYNEDDFPMWMLYGDNGTGVCLGFDEDCLENGLETCISHFLHSVAYDNYSKDDMEILSSLFNSVKKAIDETYSIETMIAPRKIKDLHQTLLGRLCPFISAFIKTHHYAFENEVRLMSLYNLNGPRTKFRINHKHEIIPYVELAVPISCLKSITLGPHISDDNHLSNVETLLGKNVNDINISKSSIIVNY